MKHICLNLKRFDVPGRFGGVNGIAPVAEWGAYIVHQTEKILRSYDSGKAKFTMYFPEAHILGASAALSADSPIRIGCQGVYRENTAAGGNFGAFTTNRPASAAKALGCSSVIIGHCEERRDKAGIMEMGGAAKSEALNRILNREIRAAVSEGLDVLYCIGETEAEQPCWKEVLEEQLLIGLEGVDKDRIVIAYEPVWAIGPGKTPPGRDYIVKIAEYVKTITGGMDVIYGGGLKQDNAGMLATIPEIEGGLIALTRFDGEIGFYPDEYLDIIRIYLENCGGHLS